MQTSKYRQPKRQFSVAQVREIKRLLRTSDLTQREIASRYGVTRHCISAIARGKTWGWVDA